VQSDPKRAVGQIKQKETLAEMESRIGFVEFQLNKLKTLTKTLRKGPCLTQGQPSIERVTYHETQPQHRTQRGRAFDGVPSRRSTQQYQETSPIQTTHRAIRQIYNTHSTRHTGEVPEATHLAEDSRKQRTRYHKSRSNIMDDLRELTYDTQTPRRTPRVRTYNSSKNQRGTDKLPNYFDMLVNGL